MSWRACSSSRARSVTGPRRARCSASVVPHWPAPMTARLAWRSIVPSLATRPIRGAPGSTGAAPWPARLVALALADDQSNRRAFEAERRAQLIVEIALVGEVHALCIAHEEHERRRRAAD